jgi:transcriptional regulator with XRE-family HTH domain
MTKNNLRDKRERLGLSQSELASLIGLADKGTISRRERGEREAPPEYELLLNEWIKNGLPTRPDMP